MENAEPSDSELMTKGSNGELRMEIGKLLLKPSPLSGVLLFLQALTRRTNV
jgi:hypothetical protein